MQFIGSLFDTLIVQPIFNLLMLIYGIIPDFGLSIIIFTIIVRFLLWPLVKKQLHQAKAMRKMQPELARIKKQYKNNRQMQSLAMMDLYKSHGINPFSSIAVLCIQLPIIIAMYRVVQIFAMDRNNLPKYAYSFMENIPSIKNLLANPDQFNQNFLGIIDLTQKAISPQGISIGLIILALIAAVLQYFTTKQLSPNSDSKKRLRDVLAEASTGKETDQSEVNAIVMRKMSKFFPVMMFIMAINLPGALALYMATSNAVAYAQNKIILSKDEDELQKISNKKPTKNSKLKERSKKAPEARVTKIKAKG